MTSIRSLANDRNPEFLPGVSIVLTAEDPYTTNIYYIIDRKLLCNMWKSAFFWRFPQSRLANPHGFCLEHEKKPLK